eukprot:TRINITY_DN36969_c0_g1_i1.p1 TRINITY_DN36969_c0_g1~~TRINITY_DN36969_c0_g1_i1.p1  ORF type:complete len:659 (-),score=174.06 TRINITY_DN36969_c0_g1_i1:43-2019(-)
MASDAEDDSCSSSSLPDLQPVEVSAVTCEDGSENLSGLLGPVFRLPHEESGSRACQGQLDEDFAAADLWDDEVPIEPKETAWQAEVREESRRLMQQTCSDEHCEEELGYPRWPEEMKDPNYFRQELERVRNDPRQNPNHGRSMEDQEFWNEAARLPWAKVLLRKEQFWTERRNVWLQQYNAVLQGNRGREQLADLLEEECSTELRRLVAPVLHFRVVEQLLLSAVDEAAELGLPFGEFLESLGGDGPGRETLAELRAVCLRLSLAQGEKRVREAAFMHEELDGRLREVQKAASKEREQQASSRPRTIIDMEGLRVALEYGQKCKKDGLVEWKRDNFEEALFSWRQGDSTLRRFRAPFRCEAENSMLRDLHASLLRNVAQAALRLGRYGEALEAADRAIELSGGLGSDSEEKDLLGCSAKAISSVDIKAWYRRHLALEALGRFCEAADCLRHIEEASVGRPDGERLRHDCKRRWERLRQLTSRGAAEEGRMLRRGLRRNVFSTAREGPSDGKGKAALQSWEPPQASSESQVSKPSQSGEGRKRLTRDGAREVLQDLASAYGEPSFVQRVDKLSRDLHFEAREFAPQLARLSLEAQRPVLEKWGFEGSLPGAQELKLALQDHTSGDPDLLATSEKVSRLLYGSPELQMYERVQLLLRSAA